MGGTTRNSELDHIRAQAKRHGIAIRSRRDRRSADGRSYRLLHLGTGKMLGPAALELDDLKSRLWWAIRQDQATQQPGGRPTGLIQPCAGCGARRIGSFRFCLSCGADFEPEKSLVAPAAAAAADPGVAEGRDVEAGRGTAWPPFVLGQAQRNQIAEQRLTEPDDEELDWTGRSTFVGVSGRPAPASPAVSHDVEPRRGRDRRSILVLLLVAALSAAAGAGITLAISALMR